jgi:hypothetical protein
MSSAQELIVLNLRKRKSPVLIATRDFQTNQKSIYYPRLVLDELRFFELVPDLFELREALDAALLLDVFERVAFELLLRVPLDELEAFCFALEVLGLAVPLELLGLAAPLELLGLAVPLELLGLAVPRELLGFAVPRELLGFAVPRELLGFAVPLELLGFAVPRELLGLAVPLELLGLAVPLAVFGLATPLVFLSKRPA